MAKSAISTTAAMPTHNHQLCELARCVVPVWSCWRLASLLEEPASLPGDAEEFALAGWLLWSEVELLLLFGEALLGEELVPPD